MRSNSGDRQSAVNRLDRARAELNADEIEVLALVAERLVMGRIQYGPLNIDRDPRDWGLESRAEILDKTAYDAIQMIKFLRLRDSGAV